MFGERCELILKWDHFGQTQPFLTLNDTINTPNKQKSVITPPKRDNELHRPFHESSPSPEYGALCWIAISCPFVCSRLVFPSLLFMLVFVSLLVCLFILILSSGRGECGGPWRKGQKINTMDRGEGEGGCAQLCSFFKFDILETILYHSIFTLGNYDWYNSITYVQITCYYVQKSFGHRVQLTS